MSWFLRRFWHRRHPAAIVIASLSALTVLPAIAIGADSAAAAPSPGYTARYIPAGTGSTSVAVDSVTNTIYLASGSQVFAINGTSRAVVATISLPKFANPGVAVDTATHDVYVEMGVGTSTPELAVIDGATNTVAGTISLPAGAGVGFAMAADSATHQIYVSATANTTTGVGPGVFDVDGSTGTVVGRFTTGGSSAPIGLAVDDATNTLWTVGPASGGEVVTELNASTGATVNTLTIASDGSAILGDIGVNPVTDTVYATLGPGIVVIDGSTATVTATLHTSSAGYVAVDPTANVVFVTSANSSQVMVVDGATNSIVDTLNVLGRRIAADTATGLVYIATLNPSSYPGVWELSPSATNAVSPVIYSGLSSATFTVGSPGLATFFTAGLPNPALTEAGPLPNGVTLGPVSCFGPCAAVEGTPVVGSGGVYPMKITASNGVVPDFTQDFTLTVTGPSVAVAALGAGGAPWVQAPQLGAGWHPLSGTVTAPPAVAAAPNPNATTPAAPLFIAPGTNHLLYIRSLTGAWQRLGPDNTSCLAAGAVITGSTLAVACETTSRTLSYNTATVPSAGLPQFTTEWKDLGGTLTAGPAIAPVGGTLTFFVRGPNGAIYSRTAATGYKGSAWVCLGQPAAAQQAATGTTDIACQGPNHGLYVGTVTSAGLSGALRAAGTLAAAPAIAPTTTAVALELEGTNHLIYAGTTGGAYTALGTLAVTGVHAAALN